MYSHFRLILLLLVPILTLACGISANTQTGNNLSMDVNPTVTVVENTTVYTKGEVCNSGGLNVRSEPGLDAPVIANKQDGDHVTLTGDMELRDGVLWLRIGGGWVAGKYVCIGE